MTEPAIDPASLGATCLPGGVGFALETHAGEAVELCLFDQGADHEHARIQLEQVGAGVWRGVVAGIGAGQHYGYRVSGPYRPLAGHRFNPNKLLIDPYARLLSGPVVWDDATFGYDPASPDLDLGFDTRDSAPFMPRSVVVDPAFDWGDDRPPRRPWNETFIYEAHAKGLTRLHPDVPPGLRGTYEALACPAVIDHLLRLGITALELLPVQAFADDRFLVRRGLTNYWGYSTLAFCAPERRYLGPAGPDGLRAAVKALHAAGIEVILDVVYNHTAELEETGPTLSLRGVDNALAYKPEPGGDARRTLNCTGCGNALDLSREPTRRLVLESLRRWVREYRVDGFRFDLAATLARNPYGFDPACAFFTELAADLVLRDVKVVAEPWDIGEGGYRLGQFPAPWREWNDKARDGIRGFWSGKGGRVSDLAATLSGSSAIFEPGGRGPLASIVYACSHDGFTLADQVSYEGRHNWANGESNRDGHGDNLSWNCGVEGPSDDPAIRAMRARQVRNHLAVAMLSQGVPMLLMGDELSRSQRGNNNAYCQDDETSWLDWESGRAADPDLPAFVASLAALRRTFKALRRDAFFTGERDPATGLKDVFWLAPDGREIVERDWHDPSLRAFGMQLGNEAGDDDRLLLLVNGGPEPIAFRLAPEIGPGGWRLVLDTGLPTGRPDGPGLVVRALGTFVASARSVCLFRGC